MLTEPRPSLACKHNNSLGLWRDLGGPSRRARGRQGEGSPARLINVMENSRPQAASGPGVVEGLTPSLWSLGQQKRGTEVRCQLPRSQHASD